jgi:hypothetical protein
LKLHFL